ncbi:TonB-dependent receptor plug domain-containing protein [Spirosoma sp. HMF3257]|uniref:TonB-dependent receptor n=1 Tax=Spirosoma telluris TaxID=2183553 RepID=A0A327NXX7_9BACT|nr:TonB-dependent receptor plug domain-containing protein [Spirosoma telluris]RAI78744.1 TonB-dependent receptor [Spirosoma telluris]
MNYTFYLFLLLGLHAVQAATLKGSITDARTGEPLIGATVTLVNTKFGGTVGLDGHYVIKGVPAGTYACVAQYISYQKTQKMIVVGTESVLTQNFSLAESNHDLAEIVVTASGDREQENNTRKTEQKAENVLNIIGAKAISLLPDITVANVLARVSGVSVVRNGTGDGQFAIIRGMDRRYNYTLVNGIKIPSPDNKNRYVPMDIFPADLLERLEVVKALTPSMEGDAIGGSMNMIMRSAPDYLVMTATASGGYSQIFGSQPFQGFSTKDINFRSPSEIMGSNTAYAQPSQFSRTSLNYNKVSLPVNGLFSLSIGNRIFNHRLGFLLGGSYQHTYRGGTTTFFSINGQPSPDPVPNTPIFTSVDNRINSNEQARTGLNAKFDYAFTERHKLSLYGLYMQLDDKQHRTILGDQLTKFGDISTSERSVFRRQNIYSATLQGDHIILGKATDARLKLNWSAVYSQAKSQTPSWASFGVTYRVEPDLNGNPVNGKQFINPVSYIWTRNSDRDLTGYLNLTYYPLPNAELSVGGMYRDKDRTNYYNDYSLSTVLPGGDRQIYTTIDQATLSFFPAATALSDSANGNNYTAKEQIAASYVQGKVTLAQRWQLVGGVRFENTNQSYVSQLPVTSTGKTGKISYLDVLPSLHLKYQLSGRENVRFSYFRGISRPGYFELVPANFPGDYYTESGNPYLKHTVADNIDLRYELFPGGSQQLLIGGFFKTIKDPIEYGFNVVSNVNTVYQPLNFGTATNFGAELVFSKFWRDWGVTGNYTFTKSSITTTKRVYGRDAQGSTVVTDAQQTRPLQGQSDHIANLSLVYKNQRINFDAQLAWVYTGKRINVVSPYLNLDYWQRGTSQVDFSAEKRLGGKRFSVFAKLTNLLNNPIISEVLKPNTLANLPEQIRTDRILVQKDVFGQSYLIGFRYRH